MKNTILFDNQYNNDKEMQDIINNANKVFSPYFLNDNNIKDREILYETIYGFKQVLVDDYGLTMDNIYDNLSHVKAIVLKKSEDLAENKANVLGYFSAIDNDSKFTDQYFSTITIVEDKNKEIEEYRETLTHELVHLFSQEYIKNENGLIIKDGKDGLADTFQNKYLNEVMTQKVAIDILEKLEYTVQDKDIQKYLNSDFAHDVTMVSRGEGYASISQTGVAFESLFKDTIYSEMFDHTNKFTDEIERINGKLSFQEIDGLLESSLNNTCGDDSARLYKEISNIIFKKVESENFQIADYLNLAKNMNEGYGCILNIDNQYMNILNTVSTSKEIEHFYGVFNKNFDLKQEINPFTRCKDCEDFLIVMQSLKDPNIECNVNKIGNLTWKELSRNDNNIILTYVYDDKDYLASAKKDVDTGIISMQKTEPLSNMGLKEFVELCNLKKEDLTLKSKEDFMFIANLANISDYSDMMININNDPKIIIQHSMATLNSKVFSENIERVNMVDIVDDKNNNLLHILARNEDRYNSGVIIKSMVELNSDDTNTLLNKKNDKGKTPVDIAIMGGNFSLVNNACSVGLNIENANKYDVVKVNDEPLIHHLYKNDDFDTVVNFIKNNYNVHTLDNNGNSVLHLIMEDNSISFKKQAMNELIHKDRYLNANVENSNYMTPLINVCKLERICFNEIKYLCKDLNADTNYKNKDDKSAIHYLLEPTIKHDIKTNNSALRDLIECGVDVELLGSSFNYKNELISPIQIATGADYFQITDKPLHINYDNITTLVNCGADINQTCGNIPSALEMAHETKDIKMFESFIDGGVKMRDLRLEDSTIDTNLKSDISKYYDDNIKESSIDLER